MSPLLSLEDDIDISTYFLLINIMKNVNINRIKGMTSSREYDGVMEAGGH